MASTGPPLKAKARNGLALGVNPLTEPLVVTVARASELLGVDPGRLAVAVDRAELPAWGRHASGVEVWRWPELCRVAAAAGISVPKTRPTVDEWRSRRERKRKVKQP
jgi:hypothetical protein